VKQIAFSDRKTLIRALKELQENEGESTQNKLIIRKPESEESAL